MDLHHHHHQQRDRRPDALGNLEVLPDELLCAILELLSPPDLARLSCVSSVMYILCNEEPLWMSVCLRIGGLLEYKSSWKKTTLHRQNLCTRVEERFQKPLQFDGFNSVFLYRRWYRCFTSLDAFSAEKCVVERKDLISMEDFRSHYDGKRPVLLANLAKTWPARNNWTFDQLLGKYGDVIFRISQRSSKKTTMKFKDYVSYMEAQHDEDPLYIFDDKFGEAAPPLLEDYRVPHLFQEDYFDVLDDERPPFRWLIIGPARSGASWHVDPALTSAWNTLLSGRKRWALYPPGRVPVGVTVHVSEEDGDVNIDSPSSLQWWLDIYPLLADHDKPLECTQLPGETIFVPSGWWHCVLNLEPTIAVTQNFVNDANFEFVCLDMAPGHLHKGVCRAGLLAIQDKEFGSVNTDASFGTNQLNYPDMTRREKRLKVLEHRKEKPHKHVSSPNAVNGQTDICKRLQDQEFSYDINFLAMFLEKDRDHYNSIWSPGNCIGPRELRGWLHKLWVAKPALRPLIWRGACLALSVDKWASSMMQICACHNLPAPSDDEKLPVGTGSNPVFLSSGYVIKIYVEGGLESSIHGLGTELEFYNLLQLAKSPLVEHIPDILASGLLIHENGFYRALPWDGKGIPDEISNSNLDKGDNTEDGFSFSIWSKKKFELEKFELENPGNISRTSIFPYMVTKRCKGDIFANLRDILPRNDLLHLASFLGDQVRNLHLLPLPRLHTRFDLKIGNISITKEGFHIPLDWELIVATLEGRRKNIKNRLAQWGDPIPDLLIDKVEEYISPDLILLLDLFKDNDGLYKVSGSPTWIHSDIMDDNIHMEPCQQVLSSENYSLGASLIANGTTEDHCVEGNLRKWQPTHLLDFSDLSVGDPLYDVIPIYLDVFRGDVHLLKQFLQRYGLPLQRTCHDGPSSGQLENEKDLKKLSYRAMCYCILHEDNVLGAIFSLWKELKMAKTWEQVEEVVWGELNNYGA